MKTTAKKNQPKKTESAASHRKVNSRLQKLKQDIRLLRVKRKVLRTVKKIDQLLFQRSKMIYAWKPASEKNLLELTADQLSFAYRLSKHGVVLLDFPDLRMVCLKCCAEWSPNLQPGGKLRSNFWQCPNGCNVKKT